MSVFDEIFPPPSPDAMRASNVGSDSGGGFYAQKQASAGRPSYAPAYDRPVQSTRRSSAFDGDKEHSIPDEGFEAPAPVPAPVAVEKTADFTPHTDTDAKGAVRVGPTEPYPEPATESSSRQPPKPLPKTTSGAAAHVSRLLKEKELAKKLKSDTKPAATMRTDVESQPGNPTAASMPGQDNNGASAGPQMMKIGWVKTFDDVLLAAGLPSAHVGPQSVVRLGLMEKKAAVDEATEMGDDAALYLKRDDVHPLALSWFMASRYGNDWTDWEPETIKQSIVQDTNVEVSDIVANKLAAIQAVVKQPQKVMSDWHIFEKVCVAFDGNEPRMTIIEDLSPEALNFGKLCIDGILNGRSEPSPELSTYVACRLHDAGMVATPLPLAFADAELQKLGAPQPELRKAVLMRYAEVLGGSDGSPAPGEPEAINIQVSRILRCNAYALDKADDLIRQIS